MKEKRPWGYFEVMEDTEFYKIKKLVVAGGQRLSHQRHERRSEHWYVLRGDGEAMVDGWYKHLSAGTVVDIPVGAWHRLENKHPDVELIILEVQTGSYFGEDDIERRQDDYGRED